MTNKIRGITIQIGGDTSPLVKSFKQVEDRSKAIQKQLNDVNKLLKFDPKNTELLAQKQDLLSKKIEASSESLQSLKKIQENMDANGIDKNSEQYQALRREIQDTEIRLESLQSETKEVSKALGNITPGSGFDKVKKKIEEVQKTLTDVGKKMQNFGSQMSMKVTLPLTVAGTAAFSFAADLEDAMGATEQIFKTSADDVKKWAGHLQTYYGIAEGDALSYANTMGAMLQNIGGLSEAEAAKQSALLVELAGDMAAMYGGTTEEAVNALTGALKGNNSMLDNYAMGVNEATIKSKALELGLIDVGQEMTLQAKQAATLALITEQTADTQGQAAREADGASGSVRSMTTSLKNLGTQLGQVLLPIITPVIQKISEFVGWFSSLDSSTKSIIVVIGLVAAAIGPLISLIGTLSVAAGALNVALLPFTGTVMLIVAAIAAVIAIGVLLYQNWETIKQVCADVFNGIVETVQGAIATVVGIFNGIIDFVKDNWQGLLLLIVNPFAGAFKLLYDNFDGFRETVDNLVENVKGFFSDMGANIGVTINSLATKVTNVFNTIKNAIMNPIETAKNFVKNMIDSIKGFFNFEWSFPKLKMPHFSIKGSWNPIDWLKQGVPKISVDWYADGGIFNQPTLIPSMNGMKGVGEYRTGGEVVMSINKLKGWITDAVGNNNQSIVVENYFTVDGAQIGTKVAPATNKALGNMNNLRGRGRPL